MSDKKAVVDPEICSGCSVCVDTCPSQAIEMQGDKAFVHADKCNGDGICVDTCPLQAIALK